MFCSPILKVLSRTFLIVPLDLHLSYCTVTNVRLFDRSVLKNISYMARYINKSTTSYKYQGAEALWVQHSLLIVLYSGSESSSADFSLLLFKEKNELGTSADQILKLCTWPKRVTMQHLWNYLNKSVIIKRPVCKILWHLSYWLMVASKKNTKAPVRTNVWFVTPLRWW